MDILMHTCFFGDPYECQTAALNLFASGAEFSYAELFDRTALSQTLWGVGSTFIFPDSADILDCELTFDASQLLTTYCVLQISAAMS